MAQGARPDGGADRRRAGCPFRHAGAAAARGPARRLGARLAGAARLRRAGGAVERGPRRQGDRTAARRHAGRARRSRCVPLVPAPRRADGAALRRRGGCLELPRYVPARRGAGAGARRGRRGAGRDRGARAPQEALRGRVPQDAGAAAWGPAGGKGAWARSYRRRRRPRRCGACAQGQDARRTGQVVRRQRGGYRRRRQPASRLLGLGTVPQDRGRGAPGGWRGSASDPSCALEQPRHPLPHVPRRPRPRPGPGTPLLRRPLPRRCRLFRDRRLAGRGPRHPVRPRGRRRTVPHGRAGVPPRGRQGEPREGARGQDCGAGDVVPGSGALAQAGRQGRDRGDRAGRGAAIRARVKAGTRSWAARNRNRRGAPGGTSWLNPRTGHMQNSKWPFHRAHARVSSAR